MLTTKATHCTSSFAILRSAQGQDFILQQWEVINTGADVTHADMDIHNEFIAGKKEVVFYAGKAVLNKVHAFFDIDGSAWSFAAATGFTFKIWEERDGGLLKITWSSPTNLTWSGNELVLNAPATDTTIATGRYYYEIEYMIAGGYGVLVAYGEAKFI